MKTAFIYYYKIAVSASQRTIQMDCLLKALHRQQTKLYQLRYAFTVLKGHSRLNPVNVSFRDQQAFKSIPQPASLETQNHELYLKYIEEVLLNKEQELAEKEDQLKKQKKRQEQQQIRKTIISPLALTHQSETLNKKIKLFKEIMLKYVKQCPQLVLDNEFEKLVQSLQLVEETCKHNYDQLKEDLLYHHQEISSQKDQLTQKLNKLQQLEHYQRYLTQLQQILENKEGQLVQKQKKIKSAEESLTRSSAQATPASLQFDSKNYNTFQEEENIANETSIRKRAKIFQQKSTNKKLISAHKQSSHIMQQYITNPVMINTSVENWTASSIEKKQRQFDSLGVQTMPEEDPRINAQSLVNKQAAYVKFLKLWFKYSNNKTKNQGQHAQIMTLYRWKINALYDQNIKESVKNILWPRKLQKLGSIPNESYAKLTLRKQVFLEGFFDYERRKFQQKKVQNFLRSILKNKNRKQRLVALLFFRKYRGQSKLDSLVNMKQSSCSYQEYPLREVTTLNSQNTNVNSGNSRAQKQSRLFSNSSGYLQENLKQSTVKSRVSKNSASQANQLKQKGKEGQVDINKLKEYIKNQQEVELKLASECSKTEGMFRMLCFLKDKVNGVRQSCLTKLIRNQQNSRIDELLHVVNNYEFKWELFMAKARLALTSNSNKVAHLEQLLSFMGNEK